MAASGVEVSQQTRVELVAALVVLLCICSFGVGVVGDHVLDGELCVSVGVGGTERALLGNGNHVGESRGISVDGGRRGEDDVGDVVLLHAAQQAESAIDVDTVVLKRDLSALANGLEGGKVDDIVDVRVLLKHLVESLLVGDVALGVFGALAGDELDAVEDLVGRVVEVVDDDDLVVGLEEGEGREGSDIAGTTSQCDAALDVGVKRGRWRVHGALDDDATRLDVPGNEDRSDDHFDVSGRRLEKCKVVRGCRVGEG